jgi:hypothetical protein
MHNFAAAAATVDDAAMTDDHTHQSHTEAGGHLLSVCLHNMLWEGVFFTQD